MKLTWIILTVAVAIGGLAAANGQGIGWALINAKIRRDFPDVKRITTAELASWLADEKRTAPLLLDVRTQEEYAVSHLRGARQVDPDASADVLREPKDRPIVTYCSVGYRSGGLAQRLQAAGFSNVANLEGSIFRWANEGRPVFAETKQVAKVHPYSRTWGLLLRPDLRAPLSAQQTSR